MQLRNKMKETKGTKFKALREAACKDIKERWGELPPELVLPAFLDLRFKDLDFLSIKKEDMSEELISMLKGMVISEESESEKKPISSQSKLAKNFGSGGDIKKKGKNEFEKYTEEEVTHLDEEFDALDWWKRNAKDYPKLSAIAHDYLSIPASSAPVERLFSMAGDIVTKKRSKLDPEIIDSLLVIKPEKEKKRRKMTKRRRRKNHNFTFNPSFLSII
eukprot:TRINITY_DN4625_c1_g1_i11.p3 TRINITY_DN4625_c1_g1~~TRINITY_DN4625_c1_g1_i11.p3  ORF type:complete len:218 (+),score=36.66 TRINITY_DN4625_c1_g1_i11:1719-2372(+)